MDANLHIVSELVDGAIIHPTLPMSFLGEKISINGNNYSKTYSFNFNTVNTYKTPFFILFGTARVFYWEVVGSGNSFTFNCERAFKIAQGSYIFYSGEKQANVITLPMLENATLYIGDARG